MKKGHKQKRNIKGVALIVVIGVLSLLVIIGTYFAINMQLEQKAAANFLNSVKAKYLAEMGIQKTIADIRSHVRTDSYTTLINYITNYSTEQQEISGIGTYQIFIGTDNTDIGNIGEDDKINLNALSDTDYVWIDDLYNGGNGLTYDEIAEIIDYCDPDQDVTTSVRISGSWKSCTGNENNAKNLPFTTLEEVKLLIEDKYNMVYDSSTDTTFKDKVTIYSPIIRGGLLAEYYDSVTGTTIDKSSFVGKIIEPGEMCEYHWPGQHMRANNEEPGQNNMPGSDGEWWGWEETHNVAWAGMYLLTPGDTPSYGVLHGFGTFGVILKGFIEILPDDVGKSITFYLRADDGSRLYIDGEKVAEAWYDKGMEPPATGNHTFDCAGWHPIRIEYYENGGANGLELKWSEAGEASLEGRPGNYVPAERLGYYAPVTHPIEASMTYNSAGIYKLICIGKVGNVKSGEVADEDILAEKKIEVVAKIFGTWTQTTREEFYGAWFNDYDNYADGEIRNVTWLNSCPINSSGGTKNNAVKLGFWDDFDEDLAYSALMLEGTWNVHIAGTEVEEEDLITEGDLVWDAGEWSATFGEEVAPGVLISNFTSGKFRIRCRGGYDTDYKQPWTLNAQNKHAEINYKYYQSTSEFGYDIFAEADVKEEEGGPADAKRPSWEGNGTVAFNAKLNNEPGSYTWKYWYDDTNTELGWTPDKWDYTDGSNGFPLDGQYQLGEECERWPVYKVWDDASEPPLGVNIYNPVDDPDEGPYRHVEAPWAMGWWWPRIHSGTTGSDDPNTAYYDNYPLVYVLVKDVDLWAYGYGGSGDECELVLKKQWWDADFYHGLAPYEDDKTLTVIGKGNSYYAFVDGSQKASGSTGSTFNSAVGLLNNNLFNLVGWGQSKPNKPPIPPYLYNSPPYTWTTNVVNLYGSSTDLDVSWDNIRVIFESGHLVSTPLFAGYDLTNPPSSDITWGTISYTIVAPANTSANLYIRTATGNSNPSDPSYPSGLPEGGDTGWSAVTSGQSISTINGDWLQYKVDLSTNAINTGNYNGSQATPVLEDITITYLPYVEVLSWKEETE